MLALARRLVMKLAPVIVLAAAPLLGAAPVEKAVAVLQSLGASGVSGKVTFTKAEGGVRVQAEISGLKEGPHGFHVHEFGDCSALDGASAGGHFNPGGVAHAGPADAARHAGDLGNVEAGKDGNARLDLVVKGSTLEGPDGILGRGVIVHEKVDDLKTQPTGNAGGRVACGVVGATK
jgi:Cu-Zn family superoxide dismutase